jgi:hypothetical protein
MNRGRPRTVLGKCGVNYGPGDFKRRGQLDGAADAWPRLLHEPHHSWVLPKRQTSGRAKAREALATATAARQVCKAAPITSYSAALVYRRPAATSAALMFCQTSPHRDQTARRIVLRPAEFGQWQKTSNATFFLAFAGSNAHAATLVRRFQLLLSAASRHSMRA